MPLTRSLAVTLLALAALYGLRPARADDGLPPGPGRDITLKLCSACHGIDLFQSNRLSRALWETTINNMAAAGMTISDEEYETVAAYLTTYLGPAPRPAPAP